MNRHPRVRLLLLVLTVLVQAPVVAHGDAANKPVLSPFKQTGVYELGEEAGWSVATADAASSPTLYCYTIKQNNFTTIASGKIDLSEGPQRIAVRIEEPAMLYAEVMPVEGATPANTVVAGAAVAPAELAPVAPPPEDFDEFWQRKIALLKETPQNVLLKPADSGQPGVEYGTIRMVHALGGHIHGQYAQPARDGKSPALLVLQWASPPYPLDRSWVAEHAARGWLTLNIEPHDVLPTEPQSYYDALPQELKQYEQIGRDNRDRSYFLRMYLADYIAADYLVAHPKWDGKTLVVMGTSMGGQQALCVAGLHPRITHLIVNVPAGCDLNAELHRRQGGYPFFSAKEPKTMETARYFDAVNFARSIRARSLVAMGFVDTVCPPAGIWTAFNQIPAPKEAVPMVDSPHNHQATPEQQAPFTRRSAEWLDALVRGQEIPASSRTASRSAP